MNAHSILSTTTTGDPLWVLFNSGGGSRTASVSRPVVLGRDASCDLRIDDWRVGPRHAEIYRVGELWWVRDLGSVDGTYLDEECIDVAPIAGPATLQLGAGGPTIRLEPGIAGG